MNNIDMGRMMEVQFRDAVLEELGASLGSYHGLYVSNIWSLPAIPPIPDSYAEDGSILDISSVLLPDGRIVLRWHTVGMSFTISPVAPSGEAIKLKEVVGKESFWAWSERSPLFGSYCFIRNDWHRDTKSEDEISWYYQHFTNSLTPAQMDVERRYRAMCKECGVSPDSVSVRKWFDKPF
jgi:hypothetical protein